MNSAFYITIILLLLLISAGLIAFLGFKFLNSNRARKKLQEYNNELELKVNSLEMETIKYKLNPHLFKNTLNSIQSHAYQTYYALDKLANVLDFILYESDEQFVLLKDEIGFALNLIEINRLKISPLFDLRIKNKIEDSELYSQLKVAPLITVDLIENAFKHADLQKQDAFIAIKFELKKTEFHLTVSNKVSEKLAIKKENSGFGKENFKKRLDIIYKNRYKLDQYTENGVYIAHLTIQLHES
ncbi:MAG: histidine kinase [Bacteroidota bacterium]